MGVVSKQPYKMNKISQINNKGISYLEVVVAVAIIAYIVTAFAQMFIKNSILLNQAKMKTLAQNWAADKMEDIKTRFYSNISTGTWSGETEVLGKYREFTRIVSVEQVGVAGLKEVEVEVTWTELNENKQVRIVSYIADY